MSDRIARNEPIGEALPSKGRIHIERQLPFLLVYRRPVRRKDEGTERLAATGASYLVASGAADHERPLRRLVQRIAEEQASLFGAFLVLEIWCGDWPPSTTDGKGGVRCPRFRILPSRSGLGKSLDVLREALTRVRLDRRSAGVDLAWSARCAPAGLRPLVTPATAAKLRCSLVGLDIDPVFRDPETQVVYPALLRKFTSGLSRALRKSIHDFACTHTTQCPVHYEVLGPRAMAKSVWEADRRLADLAEGFDFLLQVTPVNAEQAWLDFGKAEYDRAPTFHYRPSPLDPIVLKRQLFATPVEKIDDPAMSQLFGEKLDELDRQIGLLHDIGTERFAPGSVQLYGGVDEKLHALARDVAARFAPGGDEDRKGATIGAAALARLARKEVAHYRKRYSEMKARVEIRDDIHRGLMVSQGNLLIGRSTRVSASRALALLQHEVGTHCVTYYNGRAQPLRQLYTGLAGYEPLQEGLAVFSEYLTGQLTSSRLGLLALRVISTRHMLDGATFVETFRELSGTHGLEPRTAFTVAMRVFRGGGLTKDAVYLAGLARLLRYLSRGGRIEPLFVGKIAVEHVPLMRELRLREVLRETPLLPRYLDLPGARERLDRARGGIAVHELSRP